MAQRIRSSASQHRRLETRLCISICTLLEAQLGLPAGDRELDNPAPVDRERVVALLRLLAEGGDLTIADQTVLDHIISDKTNLDGVPRPAFR